MSEFYDPRASKTAPPEESDNIFIQFGFPPSEAEKLLAEADRKIMMEISRRKALGLPNPSLD